MVEALAGAGVDTLDANDPRWLGDVLGDRAAVPRDPTPR
jgi:hypothetical protein